MFKNVQKHRNIQNTQNMYEMKNVTAVKSSTDSLCEFCYCGDSLVFVGEGRDERCHILVRGGASAGLMESLCMLFYTSTRLRRQHEYFSVINKINIDTKNVNKFA